MKELFVRAALDRLEQFALHFQLIEHRRFFRLFLEPRDSPIRSAHHDAEIGRRRALHRNGRERDLGAGTNVLVQERPEIHPVELVAAQDEEIIVRLLEKVAQVLADGVGRALIPLRAFRGLLRGEDVDEAARKVIKLVARLDMAMKRHAVELRQHINRAQPGVEAVADRDIDQPIFPA